MTRGTPMLAPSSFPARFDRFHPGSSLMACALVVALMSCSTTEVSIPEIWLTPASRIERGTVRTACALAEAWKTGTYHGGPTTNLPQIVNDNFATARERGPVAERAWVVLRASLSSPEILNDFLRDCRAAGLAA